MTQTQNNVAVKALKRARIAHEIAIFMKELSGSKFFSVLAPEVETLIWLNAAQDIIDAARQWGGRPVVWAGKHTPTYAIRRLAASRDYPVWCSHHPVTPPADRAGDMEIVKVNDSPYLGIGRIHRTVGVGVSTGALLIITSKHDRATPLAAKAAEKALRSPRITIINL